MKKDLRGLRTLCWDTMTPECSEQVCSCSIADCGSLQLLRCTHPVSTADDKSAALSCLVSPTSYEHAETPTTEAEPSGAQALQPNVQEEP